MENKQHVVNLVHMDQPRAYVTRDLADTFQHLDLVVQNVFTTILARIDQNAVKLKEMNQRAAIVKAKIDRTRGSSKATRIFSSAHYPGTNSHTCPKLLFGDQKPLEVSPSNVESSKVVPYESSSKVERLEFFHIRDQVNHSRSVLESNGLGSIPVNLSSISSIFLYNTNHIPYGSNRIIDPFGHPNFQSISPKQKGTKQVIFEAPRSLKEGEDICMPRPKVEFQYLPDLADLPDLDLPFELPSLPGVADDLLYSSDGGPGIAPSIDLPELPMEELEKDLEDDKTSQPIPPPPSLTTVSSKGDRPTTLPKDVGVGTNHTLKKEHIEDSIVDVKAEIVASIPVPVPPPPPPPPPPPVINNSYKVDDADSNCTINILSQKKPPPVFDDSRSDLMAAIKMAGGASKAKLKKTTETSLKNNQTKNAPAGDFFSDLFSKLSQRRRGISGGQTNRDSSKMSVNKDVSSKASSESNTVNTLQRLSSIIPPPLANDDNDQGSSHTDDDSWD